MEVIYKGTDITENIDVTKAEYDTSLGGRADTLMLGIRNTNDETKGWGFAEGDEVQIKEDSIDSGVLKVYRVEYDGDSAVVYAASILRPREKKYKEWKKIGFKALAKELAKNLGYKIEFYGVEDYVYNEVTQPYTDDLAFLAERCKLEGCALIAYKGTIRIIFEDWLESQKASSNRMEAGGDGARTNDHAYIKKCTVTDKDRKISGVCEEDGEGEMARFFWFPFSSQGEARRFAKNILHAENRKQKTGVIYSDGIQKEIAAGTLLAVDCGDWTNKKAVITRVRYDFDRQATKMWFRLLKGD